MEKHYTQQDLVVLYLAQHGDWVKSFELKGKFYKDQIIGSEGDRRAIELFEKDKDIAKREVDKIVYTIIREKEGRYRKYKVISHQEKPLNAYQLHHAKMMSMESIPANLKLI